jgi:hypothetical protein
MTKNKLLTYFSTFVILSILYVFLYKILMPRVNNFGCFDDCLNYLGGYFMSKGRKLYSEIIFNHQPFMAYISYAIQTIMHPRSIYELLLTHRQFLFLFSFAMNLILLIRFKWPALGFVFFYEFTKYYIFGDRFLAENFIVYPIVYMGGLVFYKMKKSIVSNIDYILSAIFTWFVIFMREPYVILALFIFAIVIIGKSNLNIKKISVLLFISLTTFTLCQIPLRDYIYNVVTITGQTVFKAEANSNILSLKSIGIFFYPIFIFFTNKWNIFQQILAAVDIVFIALIILCWIKSKSKKLVVTIIVILGLANLREIRPGIIFYGAFHLIQWYGLFLFFIFLMLDYLLDRQKRTIFFLSGILTLIFVYFLLAPTSYIHEKIDPQYELITNYGRELQIGEVVRKLSKPSDTLFLDGFEDLIYWQSGRISSYKYSLYLSVARGFQMYQKERLLMLINNPPDFYYGLCLNKQDLVQSQISLGGPGRYVRLYDYNKPSCLFVNEKKIPDITLNQWKNAKEFGYTLKPDTSSFK